MTHQNDTMNMSGLLVVYPAVATAVAVVVGLSLSAPIA